MHYYADMMYVCYVSLNMDFKKFVFFAYIFDKLFKAFMLLLSSIYTWVHLYGLNIYNAMCISGISSLLIFKKIAHSCDFYSVRLIAWINNLFLLIFFIIFYRKN